MKPYRFRKMVLCGSVIYLLCIIISVAMRIYVKTGFAIDIMFVFRTVFCMVLAFAVFGKTFVEKDLYLNTSISSKGHALFIAIGIATILLWIGNTCMIVVETYMLDTDAIGSVCGMLATMIMVNVASNTLKKYQLSN